VTRSRLHALRSFPRKQESRKPGKATLTTCGSGSPLSRGRTEIFSLRSNTSPIQISNSHAASSPRRDLRPACDGEGRTARRQTQASPECRIPLLRHSRLSAHRPKRRFGARLKPDRTIPGPRLRACANRAQAVQRAPRARVVVPVERGPEAPRCLRARQTAGAAPQLRSDDASRERPSMSEVAENNPK
jgi:hypothetical protein